jgi:hypothetical protein
MDQTEYEISPRRYNLYSTPVVRKYSRSRIAMFGRPISVFLPGKAWRAIQRPAAAPVRAIFPQSTTRAQIERWSGQPKAPD